jgi:hypothetical protein
MYGPLLFWHGSSGLFNGLKQEYSPSDWWFFTDSLQRSLKAVLLHNGNSKPSIPIARSAYLKEAYDKMKMLLEAIPYNVQQWNICGYLKVTGMLMGRQRGFAKFCCFLCPWDSGSRAELYIKRKWEWRTTYEPEKHSVQHIPLINPMKIFLPLSTEISG